MGAAGVTTAVCEIGPATIGRLACGTARSGHAEPVLASAALDGGDGRFVLVDDQPLPIGEAWRAALQPVLDGADRAVLIHPSWWPAPRIDTARRAAEDVVEDVDLIPRWQVLAHPHDGGTIVIETAPHAVVVLLDGAPIAVCSRSPAPDVVAGEVARIVVARRGDRPVIIDAPLRVSGADTVATLLLTRLSAARVRAVIAGEDQMIAAAEELVAAVSIAADAAAISGGAGNGPRRRWGYLAAGIAAVAVTAVGVATEGPERPGDQWDHQDAIATTALVDGRVVMQVPADWAVRRVTDGPGSARVEVMSPADQDAVLHLTQSRLAVTDLAATAAALRSAVDAEPSGVFVDFNPADTRGGRPAVTYREVRPGRDIKWTVLVDGDLRISIGCQQATSRAASVAAACDDAVRSARQVR